MDYKALYSPKHTPYVETQYTLLRSAADYISCKAQISRTIGAFSRAFRSKVLSALYHIKLVIGQKAKPELIDNSSLF